MFKICKKCQIEKDTSEYHKSKGYTDGFFSKCKECCKVEKAIYIANNPEKVRESQRNYESKNKDHRREYYKNWQSSNKEKINNYNRTFYQKNKEFCLEQRKEQRIGYRLKAMEMLGGAKCICCGCDKFEILEINHKNGNGRKELLEKWKTSHNFARAIVLGNRSIEDLDVRCKLCNILHYIDMKHGSLPFKIIWQK